ncbi:TonB-dependent receptor [Lacinutrix salivirga]
MKILMLFIMLVCSSALCFAQNLKGKIVDEYGQPLENVYVSNTNANTHAHSLLNGEFTLLETNVGDEVAVSLLGYKKETIIITKSHLESGIEVNLISKVFMLDELVITEQINALNTVTQLDLQTTPVRSSQEVLRKVPGLIIGQHAGGGKAEQIFLRGFDIDHGTDIALSVDGMPVNMVSHAHGQGYSDLHFLIPETVKNIEFGKGPYAAHKGDFSTAGYVDFETKNNINNSQVTLEYGDFNSLRTVGLFDILDKNSNQNAYVALEYIAFDGPYQSPQNFNRLNLLGKYNTYLKGNDKLSLTLSHFTSRWDASGQIPQRAIDNGTIDRFGAIDDTEGGETSRSNINIQYNAVLNEDTQLKTNAYYSKYDFELYSNFTFFLEDPINGDQIKQKEDRSIFGFNSELKKEHYYSNFNATYTGGFGVRHDINNDVELSHTLNRRETLNFIQLGDINQTNIFGYFNTEFEFGKFVVAPALRLDYFKFLYNDQLATTYETQSETKTTLSPKLNVLYNQNENLQWFLKSGISFHSNDTRVVVANNGKDVLPKAYGTDLGFVWKPLPKLAVNTAAWYLFLEQEFVYVGDAGIVEPSGKTERYGLDLGLRYQFNDWLYFDTDATLTKARSIDAPDGEDYIPLAPDFTMSGGLSLNNYKNFSGGIRYRYLDDRPANEDNSIIADGYFITDFNINYTIGKLTLGVIVENIFDVEWKETQFATESRLQNEAQPVEEIHFTPGTPFFIKSSLTYKF